MWVNLVSTLDCPKMIGFEIFINECCIGIDLNLLINYTAKLYGHCIYSAFVGCGPVCPPVHCVFYIGG